MMHQNFLGADAPAPLTSEEAAQRRIYQQVMEQRAWALEQAAPASRAKYRVAGFATSALLLGALGAGVYYLGKNQRWWGSRW